MERLRSSQLVKSVSSPHHGAFCNSLNSFTGGSRNKYMYGRNPMQKGMVNPRVLDMLPSTDHETAGPRNKISFLPSLPSFPSLLSAIRIFRITCIMYLIPN
jgi:hypothetical protein